MIQVGDIVTCIVTSQNTLLEGSDAIVQQVSSTLAAQGYQVLTTQIASGPGYWDQVISAAEGNMGIVAFQATLQIQSPAAFAQPTDLLSIVENAFYQVVGVYPTDASVPFVQTPGAPAQNTGLPSPTPSDIGGANTSSVSNVANSLSNSVADFLGSLKSLGEGALLLVVLLVFGLIYVVGYSPNTREVARAVA